MRAWLCSCVLLFSTGLFAAEAAKLVPLSVINADYEVIYGDAYAVGKPFVMRIRELPGTIIPPHSHPVDEHLTVLQGTFYFAVSDKFDMALLTKMEAGSYAFAPKGSTMFGSTPDGAIVQVHGVGPFHIQWRHGQDTFDSPDAAKRFQFHKDDAVTTPRGPGVIREGWASGTLVQYVLAAPDGSLYMAEESTIRK